MPLGNCNLKRQWDTITHILETDNTKWWWGCGATGTPILYWWKRKNNTTTLKDNLGVYNKLKHGFIIQPSNCVPTIDVYPTGLKTYVHRKTCVWMFFHNHQKLKATRMSFSAWMKLVPLYIGTLMITCRNIYRYGYTYRLEYTHIFPCTVSWESLETTIAQKQSAHLVLRSWFLIPFWKKKIRAPWRSGWF